MHQSRVKPLLALAQLAHNTVDRSHHLLADALAQSQCTSASLSPGGGTEAVAGSLPAVLSEMGGASCPYGGGAPPLDSTLVP